MLFLSPATWQSTARALATDIDASLVDDNGQPMTLHAFAAIDQELRQLYRQLEERDLAAGSPAAVAAVGQLEHLVPWGSGIE